MDAILHNVRRTDNGLIELIVSLGSQQPRIFLASYDGSDLRCTLGNLDQELFTVLSDMALLRFGNCAVYQYELMKIMDAFCAGALLPALPVELGTTRFCTLKPSRSRVAWNKLWILLRRLGIYRPRIYIAHTNDQAG